MSETTTLIRDAIRTIPDFPKPGILFFDITTLLSNPVAFRATIDAFADEFRDARLDRIVGMESRGFLFGAPLADRLEVGFVPVRKPGKLPAEVETAHFDLEYGSDSLEIHRDAISPGQRVLIIDDLLATGGTAEATVGLVRRLGAEVHACAFVVELLALGGRGKLPGEQIHSLVQVRDEVG